MLSGTKQTIAVTATFTAEPIQTSVDFWMHELGISSKVEFAPYDQVFQQLLDPSSLVFSNESGLNVVLLRFEDLGRFNDGDGSRSEQDPPADISETIERNVRHLVSAVKSAAGNSAAPLLICLCPASPSVLSDSGRMDFFQRMEELMTSELDGIGGVHTVTDADLSAAYPVSEYYDSYRDQLANVPYTPVLYASLGTLISRRACAIWNAPHKVVVLDCDQTLWKGVCGEDGPVGIAVDPPWRALQEFMVEQHDLGMLVCLCSKNNQEDVLGVFEHHPDMPLKSEHVASWRVDWSPKSEHLKSLAEELNLSLDSFIFVDDDPVECAEVRASCPEVLTLQLPRDPEDIPTFLKHVWAFDRINVTEEDKNRTALYLQNSEREGLRSASLTFSEFLTNLDLQIRISELAPSQMARVAQLTQRTNQFNLTTIRRSEEQIRRLLQSSELECLVVEVNDRFGDYGLVGAVILQPQSKSLDVDTFLLSCRALGRGVEHRMLGRLGEMAEARGLSYVNLTCMPTEKNRPALDFLDKTGASFKQGAGPPFSFRFPARLAAAVQYQSTPQGAVARSRPSDQSDPPDAAGTKSRSEVFARIALELNDAEKISEVIESWIRRSRPEWEATLAPPRTPTEEALAAVWSEVLGVDRVGTNDNFFRLGGDSLAATRVMSRVRASFGVELSFRRFFDTPTVAETCQAIDEELIHKQDETEIVVLLDEFDQASAADSSPSAGRIGPPFGTTASSTSIASVGVITCDRLDACERGLTSYIENIKSHGRAPEFVVMDDSRSTRSRDSYRQMLHRLSVQHGVDVFYGGLEEKTRFARRLVASSLPPDVVDFAVSGVERTGNTFGSNQNALMLHTVGNMLFAADDDTVCRIAPAPESRDGIGVSLGHDPSEYWFFPDRETAVRSAAFSDEDILEIHERLLGRKLSDIASEEGEAAALRFRLADSSRPPTSAQPDGRVAITFTGLLGDCGWGSPFGYWGAPMGFLLLNDESHQRLGSSDAAYRATCTSREILRVVSQPTIGDASFSMSTFMGIDNRHLLAPWLPVGRGADMIFGATLWKCFEDIYFGHVPFSLLHEPVEKRGFSEGELFRSAASYDIAKLMLDCISSFEFEPGTKSGAERLRALGKHLMDLGLLPGTEFEEFARVQARHTNRAFALLLEDHLRLHRDLPSYWAADVKKYIAILDGALTNEDYWLPLDLAHLDDNRELTRDLVSRFGKLLYWWPEIVEATTDLRARGQRVATRI